MCIGERRKLEGETETVGVWTKKRGSMKAGHLWPLLALSHCMAKGRSGLRATFSLGEGCILARPRLTRTAGRAVGERETRSTLCATKAVILPCTGSAGCKLVTQSWSKGPNTGEGRRAGGSQDSRAQDEEDAAPPRAGHRHRH